jgi:YfiR/HmsC-like
MGAAMRVSLVKHAILPRFEGVLRRGLFFFALVVCLLGLVLAVHLPLAISAGQKGRPTRYDVEAVYLYQFGRFVQWPAQPSAPANAFSICVLGQDPFGNTLDSTLAGESIAQQPIKAERIADFIDAKHCRILYISPSEDTRLDQILKSLESAPVLTVGDAPDFVSRGGMIQFVLQGNRVRFEINVAVAQKAGLTMSSQLLKVASSLRGAPAGANP